MKQTHGRIKGRKQVWGDLNDNTSPETHSFHPLGQVDRERVGKAVAVETLLRYLLTQLLVQYAGNAGNSSVRFR
jgi:hypothetical protein